MESMHSTHVQRDPLTVGIRPKNTMPGSEEEHRVYTFDVTCFFSSLDGGAKSLQSFWTQNLHWVGPGASQNAKV